MSGVGGIATYGIAVEMCEFMDAKLAGPWNPKSNEYMQMMDVDLWVAEMVTPALDQCYIEDNKYSNWAPRQRAFMSHMTGEWHVSHGAAEKNFMCTYPYQVKPTAPLTIKPTGETVTIHIEPVMESCVNVFNTPAIRNQKGKWLMKTHHGKKWTSMSKEYMTHEYMPLGLDMRYKCARNKAIRVTCVKMEDGGRPGFAMCNDKKCRSFDRERMLMNQVSFVCRN